VFAGLPAVAHAGADEPQWMFEGSGLYYSEKDRATVMEPIAKITRMFSNGRQLSLQAGLDAITGASPTGTLPTGTVQTVTSASGTVTSQEAGQIPTAAFHDYRGVADLALVQPIGSRFSTTTGGHFSREKDYLSLGVSERWSLDVLHRLATITVGGSLDHDEVFPIGGTPQGLSDGTTLLTTAHDGKRVATGLVGLSRVLTRRTLVGVTVSYSTESGYLTEPYKRLSVVDPVTGAPVSSLTENRPDTRRRTDVLLSGVQHLEGEDVVYASYREYWDDWGIRSHTIDLRYHHDLPEHDYVVPHLRFYTQGAADFYRWGLVQGQPLPAYASSDLRVGTLRTLTLGCTYGFHIATDPGEATVRAEYLLQWGEGHPADAVGVQSTYDLAPPVGIFAITAGYTLRF
jgi:hypothetical protein